MSDGAAEDALAGAPRLACVLNNARKHGQRFELNEPDPCSSGDVFHGWGSIPHLELGWTSLGLIASPGSWLLTTGWRRHDPTYLAETPAA